MVLLSEDPTQNIPATPPAAVPLSTSHKVAKPDPALQFNQLLYNESKKTFSQQVASGNVLKIGEGGLHSAFHDIPCIKDTAIKVGSRYLHANDVTFKEVSGPKFIACSAPQTQDRELFWRAAFEQADTIVDVTGLGDVEGYFPEEKDKKIVFGKMTITCTDTGPPHVYRIHDGYSGKEKNITRIHFSKWPDKQAVSVEQLENLVMCIKHFATRVIKKQLFTAGRALEELARSWLQLLLKNFMMPASLPKKMQTKWCMI